MFNIIEIEETTTVMDYIKKFKPNTVVVTNKQINGRGKYGRKWISNKSNNLYLALSISMNNTNINYSNYCFLTSVAMLKSILELANCNINIKIKWPNDILLNNKKICGILLESDLYNKQLIIGVGVNIDDTPKFSDNVIFQATSLKQEGILIDKNKLINKFIDTFENYSIDNFNLIRKQLLNYSYNLNKTITVKTGKNIITGIFVDIDDQGTLLLNCGDSIKKIYSGDIF